MIASDIKKVVTHSGIFHADDVCAIAWLRLVGVTAPVERRNPTADEMKDPRVVVVDVGGVYDRETACLDHHQRGGAGERYETGVPYAGFGLVYNELFIPSDYLVACRLDDRLVASVDAADCGWGTAGGTRPTFSFSAAISGFNPGPSATPSERDAAFEKAVGFARQVLENELRAAEEFVAAKQAVLDAHTAVGGRVLVLEEFADWGEHIFSREDQANLLYVVFPSERCGFCVQQVPTSPGSFEGRKPLPESWAGLRDEAFASATGVSDGVFCHPGRFICGAESREGAMALAALAVEA